MLNIGIVLGVFWQGKYRISVSAKNVIAVHHYPISSPPSQLSCTERSKASIRSSSPMGLEMEAIRDNVRNS